MKSIVSTRATTGLLLFLAGVSLVVFTGSAGLAETPKLSFEKAKNYNVGINPVFVVAGNFDSDSAIDLAIVNNVNKKVSILLGDGAGNFPIPSGSSKYSTFPVGKGPLGAAAGDFDEDGNLDLAVANFGDDTVTILLGDGLGAFTAAGSPISVGDGPIFIAVGDFSDPHDGHLDLAVANQRSDDVSILLGDGSGGFTAVLPPKPVGNQPVSIAVADFNNPPDGKLDLAVANFAAQTVSIFLGDGNGTFTPQPVGAVGTQPVSIVAGDFNGDDKVDLATANQGKNVSILLGNGDGTFQAAQSFSLGKVPVSLTAADFNGDGALDLAAAHFPRNQLSIILGNGDGTFQKSKTFTTVAGEFAITTGDFNGDNRPDLAVVNSKVSVLLNRTQFPGALPSLTVTNPNGGDSLTIGTTIDITWTSNDIPGSHVKIDLTRDSTTTPVIWKTIVNSVPVEDGTKSWKVTGSATTHAQIRICSVEYPAFCNTTTDFSIGP
jgi:hypothetical protein